MGEALPHKVIRASAGAGKTFRLSNQYLLLLARGASPEEVLATTFTRKAAGEILGRVLMRLAHGARDEAGAKKLAAELGMPGLTLPAVRLMLEAVAEQIHRVAIATLDSFFHRMAGCFRFELGLPRDPRMLTEGDPFVRQVRREAINAMLGDDDPQVLLALLRRLHHDTAQRRVTDAIDAIVGDLYHVYRQTDAAAWRRLEPPPWLEREALVEAIEALQGAADALPADKTWAKAWQNDLYAALRHDWDAFLCGGIAGKLAEGAEAYNRKPIPPRIFDVYRPLLAHAKAAIVRRVIEQTEATHQLLDRFDEHYTRLRREQGILLFSDIPLLLAQLLPGRDPADVDDLSLEPLYYRLDSRVQHLLLDEFQDTSPLQWQILRPFAEEIRSGEGAGRDGAPARSFFCVGDVKQAIYGWRDGCAEVFDQVMEDLHLPASTVETMAKSYRTSPVVLGVVNRVFESIADAPPLAELRPHVEAWARGFEEHKAHHEGRGGYVEMVASPAPAAGEPDEDGPQGHEAFVADYVRRLAERHPARTIGVLVRQNKTAADLLYRLRQAGVAASGEGGATLTSDPAVEVVLSAFTLADHPGHTAAAFHVLQSPLAEIVGLRSLDPDARLEASQAIRRSVLHRGYAGTVAAWADELARNCNARSAERLAQLIDLAERYEPALTLRTSDFVRFVEATPVDDPTAAAVRVMTVHKAKGLEFDVVVLPELGELIGQTARVTLWQYRESATESPTAVYRSVNKDLRPIVEAWHETVGEAYRQEVGRRVSDDLSALYVAMTRPKHALHLVVEPLRRTKSGWSSRGWSNESPAAVLRHALTDVESPAADGVLYVTGDAGWDTDPPPLGDEGPSEQKLPRFAQVSRRRSWTVVAPSRLSGGGVVAATDVLGPIDEAALAYGRGVHDELATVTWLDELQPAALTRPVRAALEQPAIRDVFERPAGDVELWRERPFAVRLDGAVVHGRFDRLVVERAASGAARSATVIDFKSDAVAGAALERAVAHHRPQAEAYRAAASALLKLPAEAVEVKLVFLHAGEVRAIDASPSPT